MYSISSTLIGFLWYLGANCQSSITAAMVSITVGVGAGVMLTDSAVGVKSIEKIISKIHSTYQYVYYYK